MSLRQIFILLTKFLRFLGIYPSQNIKDNIVSCRHEFPRPLNVVTQYCNILPPHSR